jgi:50S ribosomal protein L16 3-hydroxylase
MSIRRLVGENTAPFIEQYYQKLPFSQAGGATALCELASWEVLAQALSKPDADAMVVRRNRRYEGALPSTPEEAQQLVAEGYTLLVKKAERHDERLAELARGLAADFAAPVDIHIYCTPAQQYGFSWHYDAEEVFIVQTTGSKEYSIRKNTVNPWPLEETLPADMHYEREIMPMLKCMLNAGDWLYLPSGYWHMGAATETAISLSIGVMPRTGVDLYDHFRSTAIDSLLWRQRLPVLGTAASLDEGQIRANVEQLAQQLAADFQRTVTSRRFLDSLLTSLRNNAGQLPGSKQEPPTDPGQ